MWQYSTFPAEFPQGPLGGAETAIWSLGRELRHRHRVRVFCPGKTDGEKSVDGVTLRRIEPPFKSKWVSGDLYYRRAMKLARGSDMVVAVTCMEPALFSDRVMMHLENDLDPYVPFPAAKAKLYGKALNRFRGVSGVSQYVSRRFLNNFDYSNRVTTVLNGADCSSFSPEKRDRRRLMREYGIAQDEVVVTYVGAIHRRKGLHLLVDAFENPEMEGIRLLVVGDLIYSKRRSSDAQYLEQQIRRIEDIPSAMFAGPAGRERLTWLMASSDIFTCPSIWQDPCPLVCAEAQASGTPVVAFRSGGIPELIDDGNTGFVGDARSSFLKDRILDLAEGEKRRKKMSVKARRRAVSLLSWPRLAARMEQLLSETSQ
jgi:spore coat protein SA